MLQRFVRRTHRVNIHPQIKPYYRTQRGKNHLRLSNLDRRTWASYSRQMSRFWLPPCLAMMAHFWRVELAMMAHLQLAAILRKIDKIKRGRRQNEARSFLIILPSTAFDFIDFSSYGRRLKSSRFGSKLQNFSKLSFYEKSIKLNAVDGKMIRKARASFCRRPRSI